ncbi:MAG: NAD(P)/FAD-dependent oxidoreductase [Flavobacteriia bacterium]
MKRSDFILKSCLLTAGSILVPSTILSSCRKDSFFDQDEFNGKVLIIGAGAAGLYAGYLLRSKGISFQILEASDRIGGRLGKLSGFADYDVDTGAQWLHGTNNILGDLILQTQTKITIDDSSMSYWFENNMVTELPKDPYIFEQKNLPDISFKEYAHQHGLDASYDNIVEAIAGDQGASASLLSAYWNSKDEENWVSGDEDYKFSDTFFDFIYQQFAQPIVNQINLNKPVVSIDYSGAQIQVMDQNGAEYSCDKLILTVPISILKLNEIQFKPALPMTKTDAFARFGMGPGMKVFLKFNVKFFPENTYGGSVCAAYLDDSIGKTTNDIVLIAFVMGDQAANLHALGNDAAITNALIQELDLMFNGQASLYFMQSFVQDYTDKPFIKGAYSYSTIGMDNARQIAAEPIDNKVFFAGEAMNINGHHQTVHGAVESAYKAVLDLITSV